MSDRRSELIVELVRLSADPHGTAAWEGVPAGRNALRLRPHEPRCAMMESADSKRPVSADRPAARCTCWLRSLDELERCLTMLKAEWRPAWYAVIHRYRLCTRKPTIVVVKHGKPQLEMNQACISLVNRGDLNKRGDGQTRLIVETWRAGLDPVWVDRGVGWLAERFVGQPELPLELLHAA